jgi:hypothetical protein
MGFEAGQKMQEVASTRRGDGSAAGKESLKHRAVGELRRYAIITAYLWVLFALFGLYRRLLLEQQGISAWQETFAIVNALIFGKVILIGQALNFGRGLERQSIGWAVLGKAFGFALLLIAFHLAEEAIRVWFEGQPMSSVVSQVGGFPALLTYAAIFSVVLIPFFAFQEASRILGASTLWGLFFSGGAKRFRLVAE